MIPDIDKLLASEDKNDIIIEIDNFICELCKWGEELEQLTEQQKIFYFNQNLEREINNGGFNQFFVNSSGNFTHETVKSLKVINADTTADILQIAINQFPSGVVPSDQAKRQAILEQIENSANEIWDQLDKKFYDYEDDLNALNLSYIKKNKKYF